MTRFDVVVIGELNVDLILSDISQMPFVGKEIIAENMTYTLGSSSAIFASNLSSLGLKVAFVGTLGNDRPGDFILENLKRKGVSVDFIEIRKDWNTGITVALNYGENRATITYPGAMDRLKLADIKESYLLSAAHMHLSSCFLQRNLLVSIPELFKKAKRNGLTTSLDPQWDPFEKWELNLKELLPFVDIFLPNEKELMKLTRTRQLMTAINSIRSYVNIAAIKRGNQGSVYLDKKQIFELPAFLNTEVKDTIGAGDNFNAGFIFKHYFHSTPGQCQEFGNLVAAISTTVHGGTGAFDNYEMLIKLAAERFGYAG